MPATNLGNGGLYRQLLLGMTPAGTAHHDTLMGLEILVNGFDRVAEVDDVAAFFCSGGPFLQR